MTAETHNRSARSTVELEKLTVLLHRLVTFQEADGGSVVWETTKELEAAAERVVAEPVYITENFMGLCMELLEERLPVSSKATKAVLMFLANACLSDENRVLASNFGLPGTCVLLLQRHKELSAETLYYVFDVVSTMTANNGVARERLRPAIPYVLASVKDHSTALEVLFGASFLLDTLAMLSAANCDVIVERGGTQVLLDVYRKSAQILAASNAQRKSAKRSGQTTAGRSDSASGSLATAIHTQKQTERRQLCEGAMRWSKNALMTIRKNASDKESLAERLRELDFGVFGSSIPVDELKWALLA